MGQLCDSVNSMPIEERNELNTQALQDIYGSVDILTDAVTNLPLGHRSADLQEIQGTLDDIKDAINNSDNGSYFKEINGNIASLVFAVGTLNETLKELQFTLKHK